MNTNVNRHLVLIYKESTGWADRREEIPIEEVIQSLKASGYAKKEVKNLLRLLKADEHEYVPLELGTIQTNTPAAVNLIHILNENKDFRLNRTLLKIIQRANRRLNKLVTIQDKEFRSHVHQLLRTDTLNYIHKLRLLGVIPGNKIYTHFRNVVVTMFRSKEHQRKEYEKSTKL